YFHINVLKINIARQCFTRGLWIGRESRAPTRLHLAPSGSAFQTKLLPQHKNSGRSLDGTMKMTQILLMDFVQKSTRLSSVSETHQRKLQDAMEKWFLAEFVKAMKLPLLRKIYQAGSYDAFAALLAAGRDTDRIAVIDKVDKYHP